MNAHPVEYLLTYGSDDPLIDTFANDYLRPLQGHKRGQRVEILDPQTSLTYTMFDMYSGGQLENPRVPDPTPYLDNLIYQAMRSGDAFAPIPPEAVIGFSNCGQCFYGNARRAYGTDLLLGSIRFPKGLVVETAQGLRWTRRPESGMEQLYHFLFHLRLTMQHLAEHPIGKESSASPADVAKMLTNLPRRAAFVRSADTTGVVYTHNTPDRISGREFSKRLDVIRLQTRQKYCHEKQAVERALAPIPEEDTYLPADQPLVSRWEEA